MENSPSNNSSSETNRLSNAKQALIFSNIENLRIKQRELYEPHYSQENGIDDEEALVAEINASIDGYLKQKGVDETDPLYHTVRQRLDEFSYLNISDNAWQYGEWKDKDDHSLGLDPNSRGRERVILSQRALFGDSLENEADNTESVEEMSTTETLNLARSVKYEAYVARMKGPLFGDKRRKNDQAYREAEFAYREALGKQLEEKIVELREEGKTDEEIKDFIKQHANELARGDEAAQRALLIDKSGLLGKFLEKYANASRGKKIAYALGLGAGAAVAGVGAGLMAGAVLGATGGLALTGLAAAGSSLAWKGVGAFRTYHLRRADIFKNKDVAEFELNDDATVEGERLRMLDFLQNTSNDQLEEGERIKKRAMLFAVGSVAVGTTIGIGVHAAIDNGDWAHWWGGFMQHASEHSSGVGPTPSDAEVEAHPNEGTSPSERYPEVNNGGSETPPSVEPEPTPSRDEIIKDYIAEHAAARKIRPGQGWYQTFKELGIKRDNWDDLLKETGPELENIEYKGTKLAYWDNQANEWRMNMTEKAKMPKSALRLLIERAEENGYLKKPLGLENAASTNDVTAEASAVENAPTDTSAVAEKLIANPDASAEFSAASTLSKGESVTSMLNQLNRAGVIEVDPGHYNALMKVAGPQLAELRYSDGTPVAYLNRRYPYDWRLYMSPDSRLHPEAIRLLERLTRQGNYTLGS